MKNKKIEINFNTKKMKDWKKYYKADSYSKSDAKSEKKQVGCKCPRCEKKHFMYMEWTAKLPARKFCENCLDTNNNYNIDTVSIIYK